MWNPDDVVASLAEARAPSVLPVGAPARDIHRSPAAMRVGRAAAESGLFLFHFEQRYPLDLPASWVAPGFEDDAEPPVWIDGALPERKYQSFRHDLLIGSFHPGHRGKWSTHELCHGLVGFAWHPGASRLFNATAGRLAELLPVVLYYFLDEIGLARCPVHAEGGPLWRSFCPACEEAAAVRPMASVDRAFAEDAARFMDRELAAIVRTRREGRPIAHRFGTLDLCSDGLAYAHAHAGRLGSEAMERLLPFLTSGRGWSETLEALEERVVEVARGIALGEPLRPMADSPEAGRDAWIRQDLAFRMLTVWEQCSGDAAEAVSALVDRSRTAPFADIVADWRGIEEAFVVPPAYAVFGVGYALEDVGRCVPLVEDGLRSVCPLVMELAEDAGVQLGTFDDPPQRRPLGDRFADWLSVEHPELAPLARFEVAVRAVKADPLRRTLDVEGQGAVLCDGARVLVEAVDVLALAEGVEKGGIGGTLVDGRLTLSPTPEDVQWGMVVGRHEGELVMLEVDPEDAEALRDGRPVEVAEQLMAFGVLRPETYDL